MIRVRRRDRLWLTLVSALAALAIFAAEVATSVKIGILGLFVIMVAVSIFDISALSTVRRRVTQDRPRGTAQAREALNRAMNSGGGDWVGLWLEDIGFIASVRDEDSLTFERTRAVNNAYDGVRPYVQLMAGEGMAERRVRVRYELVDASGEVRFIQEDNAYLRSGVNTLHPDQHLPLGDIPAGQMGQWDARVYVDGRLIGVLGLTIGPTDEERLGRLGGRRDRPSSFEELLRQKRSDRD
jgi:hypothetical protein